MSLKQNPVFSALDRHYAAPAPNQPGEVGGARLRQACVLPSSQMKEKQTADWHKKSWANKEILRSANECGCFYCTNTFVFADIKAWVTEKDGSETAQCPHCEIDSVIPSQNKLLLEQMYGEWFTV